MIEQFQQLNYYEILQIPIHASSFEIRQAYKNMLAIYDEGSLATYSLFTEEERKDILSKIEKAFLTLIDNEKRIFYDNTLVNRGDISEDSLSARERGKAIPIFQIETARNRTNNLARIRKKIRERGVEEFSEGMMNNEVVSGEDLKNLREALGIELEEIFQATKISPTTLQAIERDDVANLPPNVYLKSFLKSYAEVLQLDVRKIVDGYLQNIVDDQNG